LTARSSDRQLIGTIVSTLATIYFGIFVLVVIRVPNFDPFSYGAMVAESIFAGLFSVIGLLLYIFGSKRMTWKMAKSGSIGR
jgi:hypothetical protein